MNISGVSNSTYFNTTDSSRNTEPPSIQFKDILDASKKMAAAESENTKTSAASNKPDEAREKQWTVTAPDGTIWTVTDIDASLTDSDKAFFGWPSQDETLMTLAGHVAMDRNEGTLKGPLTQDYFFGNAKKQIFGLIERFPAGALEQGSLEWLLRRFDQSNLV